MEIITHDAEETERVGIALAAHLRPGDRIGFWGELGAGKTTLIRGIVQGLDGESRVTSPTFTILHPYRGKFPIYHYDFYRLKDSEELEEIGWEEALQGDGVVLVEWPNPPDHPGVAFPGGGGLPAPTLQVTLRFLAAPDDRVILLTCADPGRHRDIERQLSGVGGRR